MLRGAPNRCGLPLGGVIVDDDIIVHFSPARGTGMVWIRCYDDAAIKGDAGQGVSSVKAQHPAMQGGGQLVLITKTLGLTRRQHGQHDPTASRFAQLADTESK